MDIMPSVLDYLHYTKPYLAFGSSIFDTLTPDFAVNYFNETYQLVRGDYALRFDGEKATALFNQKADSLLKDNLMNKLPAKTKHLETFLKAFIQQYNSRMIGNDLIIKAGY